MLAISSLLLLGSLTGGGSTPSLQTEKPLPSAIPVYNFSLLLIGRNVDDADPADQQTGWGLEFDGYNPRDFIGWELGVSRTSEEDSSGGTKFEATVSEVYTGARKTWGASHFHPYAALGLAWIEGEADVAGVGSDSDSSFALYGHGGAYWTFGEHFNLGADARALVGSDIEFGDADYFQGAIVLGYSL
jgi:hypothetical protein